MPAKKQTGKRVLPGVAEIEEMLRGGMTRKAIAAKYGVTPSAVSLALLRADRAPANPRYDNLIPWRVALKHLQLPYEPRMLRLEGRLRAGLEFKNPQDLQRLESWKRKLQETDTVIMYFAEHDCPYCQGEGGFHPVRRKDAIKAFGQPDKHYDTELIFVTREQGQALRDGSASK